jgi:SAM-dependent methyltransferase
MPDPRARPHSYDAELQRLDEVLRRACDVRAGDRVLDVGCGTGATTRDAARRARSGSALGVDLSASAIARARELARAEAVQNVGFECADAQVLGLPVASFDLAISRFGTMFFDDPAAAFANLARALRPGGRLVMMVWQAAELNEWQVVVSRALGVSASATPGVEAFSLADPAAVTGILQAAGFEDVTFDDVRQPVFYGADAATALGWVRGFISTSQTLDNLDPEARARAEGRLRRAVADHLRDDGVWFDARAWVVSARRR